MDQIVLNSFREASEKKYLYCDSCNSLIPVPGFYCVQCEPPQGPNLEPEGDLTLFQAALRIILLTILFLGIAVAKLDKYIMEVISSGEKEVPLKIAEDEDFKLIFKVNTRLANLRNLPKNMTEDEDFKLIFKINTRLANLRNLPKIKASKIIDTLKMGTQVEVVDTKGDWSKLLIKSGPGVEAKTGWVATKLLKIKASKIIGTLKMGTQVEVVGAEGDWSKVITKPRPGVEAETGWISTKLLKSEIK